MSLVRRAWRDRGSELVSSDPEGVWLLGPSVWDRMWVTPHRPGGGWPIDVCVCVALQVQPVRHRAQRQARGQGRKPIRVCVFGRVCVSAPEPEAQPARA